MRHANNGRGGEGVKRWASNFAMAFCLLLGIGTVVLWVRSYFAADGIAWTRYRQTEPWRGDGTIPQDIYRSVILVSSRGSVAIEFCQMTQDEGDHHEFDEPPHHFTVAPYELRPSGTSHLLPVFRQRPSGGSDLTGAGISWPPVCLLSLSLPSLYCIRRRRPYPGHCRRCNYNLTGNTSGVCPECGTRTTAEVMA